MHRNYEVTLEQADNLWHFQKNVNYGDVYDLYYLGNSAAVYSNRLDDTSTPNAHWWNGSSSGMKLSDFSAADMSMTFRVGASTPLPTVTVTANDALATEARTTKGQYTVTRTGSTAAALTIDFTVGGTATSGSDYIDIGTSVTIPAGVPCARITMKPINDRVAESDETVIVTVSASASYLVGSPASATVTITSNE